MAMNKDKKYFQKMVSKLLVGYIHPNHVYELWQGVYAEKFSFSLRFIKKILNHAKIEL